MLRDLIFPRSCLGCSRLGVFICGPCRRSFAYVQKDTCLYCGKISIYGYTHPDCLPQRGVDGVMSVFVYASTIQNIIKEIKYRGIPHAFHELFLGLFDYRMCRFAYFHRRHPHAVLQPVPLHRRRHRERGFNQSRHISSFFGSIASYEVINGLTRHRSTRPQAQIHDPRMRAQNIRNAFSLLPGVSVEGNTVILVDDVITSGSTVREAAATMKRAGAERVFAWSLARG